VQTLHAHCPRIRRRAPFLPYCGCVGHVKEDGRVRQPRTHIRGQGSGSSLHTNWLCDLEQIISLLSVPVF